MGRLLKEMCVLGRCRRLLWCKDQLCGTRYILSLRYFWCWAQWSSGCFQIFLSSKGFGQFPENKTCLVPFSWVRRLPRQSDGLKEFSPVSTELALSMMDQGRLVDRLCQWSVSSPLVLLEAKFGLLRRKSCGTKVINKFTNNLSHDGLNIHRQEK